MEKSSKMILDALIFHKLGHYLLVWIKKTKTATIRSQYNGLRFLFEMGGVLMNFIVAFLVILGTSLLSKEKILLNKDAIYGIQVNKAMQELGFANGDKIVSINGKNVEVFSGILKPMVFDPEPAHVVVQRKDSMVDIHLSYSDKAFLISSMADSRQPILSPRQGPDSAADGTSRPLKYSEKRGSFSDALSAYKNMFKIILPLLTPQTDAYKGIGGFKSISQTTSVKGYLYLFAYSSIVLGLLNLLPIPGLDMGNTLIALVEKISKRRFDAKKLRVVRMVCSALIVFAVIALLYL
jgi:membrane-associated protease RseP (regulator of RpoE activity)